VQLEGKIVTIKTVSADAVSGVQKCPKIRFWSYPAGGAYITPLDYLIIITFCYADLWKSKPMALEKPCKLEGILFSYFLATLL